MFDVSYAAAWELGRLLALQDKDFSTGLYQWKRQQAQRIAQEKQRLAYSHLPYLSATNFFVPEDISSWFKSLRKLEGVPFNYLVPDERMLPPESIRFFRVDPTWVDCLADGAFSIGRVASSDSRQTSRTVVRRLALLRCSPDCYSARKLSQDGPDFSSMAFPIRTPNTPFS